MSRETALLTFGIGPVHTFIAQARRVADVWAGSDLLSHLTRQAMSVVHRDHECEMIFPYLSKDENIPSGVPNRFVCRVPTERVEATAKAMRSRVQEEWDRLTRAAVEILRPYELAPAEGLWRQTDKLLAFTWSWVPEGGDYARASCEGAIRFAATRLFRPFDSLEEIGEKCAICGERTALPDGARGRVRDRWREAERKAPAKYKRFLREDQGRLCLVCTAKRFYPTEQENDQAFDSFEAFQPDAEKPYFALVMMDGDRMGEILSLGKEKIVEGRLEEFHRKVSEALTGFAAGLRIDAKRGDKDAAALNLKALGGYRAEGRPPQLIYAGGDDVLFVCDARDALPLAQRLQARYVEAFTEARKLLTHPAGSFTISAAVLFAHPHHPAGLLLRDLETLLEEGAKDRGGRNALAIRLAKRGGVPVEVILPWEGEVGETGKTWPETLDLLTDRLREGRISSKQTFTLRLEERTLREVFRSDAESKADREADRWHSWLKDRLSRNEGTGGQAEEIAELVTPFFVHDRTGALRIARFLGREAER
jgi:CRISPR-associated protein Cmr2